MKTWRVSLTYRVKSAHKVKLTDKQLLQWMVPILLVMGIYLGTWTAAEPPTATEVITRYEPARASHQLNLLLLHPLTR
jgi:G protein-coupled receptor 158